MGTEPVEQQENRESILLIEDDLKYSRLVERYLSSHGYELTLAYTGQTGLELAVSRPFSAVILDIMLPGIGGLEVLRRIREKCTVPVLLLSALQDETDRVVGLELGADDYLPKSYSPREILARLRAVIRCFSRATPKSSDDEIAVGHLLINTSKRTVHCDSHPVRLTAVEFDLLRELALAKGRIKTREQLLSALREEHLESCDRSIDVHVSAIRKKIGDDARNPKTIRTIRSVGYCLVNPEEPEFQ